MIEKDDIMRLIHQFASSLALAVFLSLITLQFMLSNCRRSMEPTSSPSTTDAATSVRGAVLDEQGPVSAAVVRIQTTDLSTTTDDSGHFNLQILELRRY